MSFGVISYQLPHRLIKGLEIAIQRGLGERCVVDGLRDRIPHERLRFACILFLFGQDLCNCHNTRVVGDRETLLLR